MNKKELLEAHAQLLAKADELRQAAVDMEDKIEQLETEDHLWKPEKDSYYYSVKSTGKLYTTICDRDNTFDKETINNFNYFRTKKEAERHALRVKAINELHKVADYLNDGWKPDWSIGDKKYYIYYSYGSLTYFNVECSWQTSGGHIYYKSRELAEKAITMLSDNAKAYIKGEL